MKNAFLTLSALVLVSACATRQTILKNDKTGKYATCGGSSTGSVAGGVIGYNIQKSNDEKCVDAYKKQGFKIVQ